MGNVGNVGNDLKNGFTMRFYFSHSIPTRLICGKEVFMDRKDYITLCIQCSVLPEAAGNIKKNVPAELIVTFDGIPYYPVGYELKFDNKGKAIHTAILHDLKAKGLVYAALDRVKGDNT